MNETFQILGLAAVASLVMAPLHAALGLHVIRRGVIFIDLAVAQVAALGISLAMAQGVEPDSPLVYWAAVGSALFGALLISLTRFKLGRIPHEAMIGIIFVLGSAGSLVVLGYAEHGQELIKQLLDGQILFVQPDENKKTAIVYAMIAAFAIFMWRRFCKRSENVETDEGVQTTGVDFLFYALIAIMVASSVQIAGVLVVFTWLVMPSVVAWTWTDKFSKALWIALPLSFVGSLAGLFLSINADQRLEGWPTGASIVLVFGGIVTVNYIVRLLVPIRTVQ